MSADTYEQAHDNEKRRRIRDAVESVLGAFTPYVVVYDRRRFDESDGADEVSYVAQEHLAGYSIKGLLGSGLDIVTYRSGTQEE